MDAFLESSWYAYLVLPLLVALARVADVTLGTMRIVFVARGDKIIAPLLGFFEVFIWIIAIGQVMHHANNFICYTAYAAGFATGNYVGLLLEEKLAVGTQMVRFVLTQDITPLRDILQARGAGSTLVEGHGTQGKVHILYTIVPRREVKSLLTEVKVQLPNVFYSIEDIRSAAAGGVYAPKNSSFVGRLWGRRGK